MLVCVTQFDAQSVMQDVSGLPKSHSIFLGVPFAGAAHGRSSAAPVTNTAALLFDLPSFFGHPFPTHGWCLCSAESSASEREHGLSAG